MKRTFLIRAVKALLLCCLCLAIRPAQAQVNELLFNRFDSEPALSQNQVYDIVQDRNGFLWFGTYNGLYRYDGYNFKLYQRQSPHDKGVPIGPVWRVFMDHTGMLWLSIQGNGLAAFDPVTGDCTHYSSNPADAGTLSSNFIDGICEDSTGNIWMGTNTAGINKWDRESGKFTRYPAGKKGLRSNQVTGCECDSEGKLWFGTAKYGTGYSLYIYDAVRDSFQGFPLQDAAVEVVTGIHEKSKGELWLVTSERLVLFDISTRRATIHSDIKGNTPGGGKIMEDDQGRIWINAFGQNYKGGVQVYDPVSGAYQYAEADEADPKSLPSNHVYAIFEDRFNNLWFGTGDGLAKINSIQRRISTYRYNSVNGQGLNAKRVRSVIADAEGNKWFGTVGGGLNMLDRSGRYRYYTWHSATEDTSRENIINTIQKGRKGGLLLGTQNGLLVLNQKNTGGKDQYTLTKTGGKKLDYPVWSVYEDPQSYIWVGTKRNGLISYQPGTGEVKHQQGLNHGAAADFSVWSVCEDRNGNVWLGTNEGLKQVRLENGNAKVVYDAIEADPEQDDNIFYIHQDRQGYLWLATTEAGLKRFDPATKTFIAYTVKDGLPSNIICGILEDEQGYLWASAMTGIFCLDPASGKVVQNYDVNDGLQGSHFNFGGAYKSHTGEMLFCGNGGANSFEPRKLRTDASTLPLFITSVMNQVDNKELPFAADSAIRLAYDRNSLSIEFAGLDYINPSKTTYFYKLSGLHNDWISNGSRNFITLSNLAPGNYRFSVMAVNNNGLRSVPRSFTISVEPPFWQTWWFYSLIAAILLAIASTYFYLWNRQKNLQRRRVLAELSSLRSQLNSHFIFNSLSSLQHFILQEQKNLALEYLNKFSRLMRLILENSKQELVTLQDEIRFLNLYVFMENIRVDNKIGFSIDKPEALQEDAVMVPPMLLQPLIENSIVHGLVNQVNAGYIKVSFRQEAGQLLCMVEDNGVGREEAARHKQTNGFSYKQSMGLKIVEDRLKVFGTKYSFKPNMTVEDVNTGKGRTGGTRVKIKIPYLERHDKNGYSR